MGSGRGSGIYVVAFLLLISLLAFTCASCGESAGQEGSGGAAGVEEARSLEFLAGRGAPVHSYEVIGTYPHGSDDFTQGLDLDGGVLFEGTGLKGSSRLLKTELRTGEVTGELALDPEYFGEGVTVLGNEVFQLTYTSGLGFVYDRDSLELKRTFSYATEGWGLTHDGDRLIMSDGTSNLYFLDPVSGARTGSVGVYDNLGAVADLNELEYVDGSVYANIWHTCVIAIISPSSGEIKGWIDLAGLNPDPEKLVDPYVLNGIAHDDDTGHLLVTGKCWPSIYELAIN